MQLARLSPDRELILERWPEIIVMMRRRLEHMGKAVLPPHELDEAVHYAFNYGEPFQIWQAGPCAVGVSVQRPWWARESFLSEEFIVRYKPGNFADTLGELQELAKGRKCAGVVIASLAMDRKDSYGHYLKRKGFREVSREYVKDIHYG